MCYTDRGVHSLMSLSQYFEVDLAKRSLVWSDREWRYEFAMAKEQEDEVETT